MDMAGFWSQAGGAARVEPGGRWLASVPLDDWPDDPIEHAEIKQLWEPPFGDRRQEIVFIGINMNRDEIESKLHDCLLTDVEMARGQTAWTKLPDPFGKWE